MKKLMIMLSIWCLTALLSTLSAQRAMISNMDLIVNNLNDSQKERLEDADKLFLRAEDIEKQIRAQDDKLNPLFKKKAKKGEKKSGDAKLLRIQQATALENAYQVIYKVFTEFVSELPFPYEDFKKRADEKLSEADLDWTTGKNLLSPLVSSAPKDLKKQTYNDIKKAIEGSNQYKVDAIEKIIEAYKIYLNQDEKKRAEELENRIWQNAQTRNTINSYSLYVSEYPNGKYTADAKNKISALELLEKQKTTLAVKINYTIQIMAVKKQVSPKKLKKLYDKTEEIKEFKDTDGLYKYRIGDFTKLDQAKIVLTKVNSKDAFIIAFKDNQRIDVKEAVLLEKK